MFRWILPLLAFTALQTQAQESPLQETVTLTQESLDQAEILFFKALAHYQAKEFEAAALGFQRAYLLTRHRDLLFNIARSREQMADKEGAIEWYRAYLGTKPADTTAMIHRIKLLGGEPTPAKAPILEPSGGSEIILERGPGPWPWLALGTGVAAAGLGTFFGLSALDAASKARGAERRPTAEDHKAESESAALNSNLSFGLSSLLLGSAVYLWWSADQEASRAGRVEILPGPGKISLIGHF